MKSVIECLAKKCKQYEIYRKMRDVYEETDFSKKKKKKLS